jgi:hypothetical protein
METSIQSNSLDPQAVSALAYEIWESLGRPEGAAEQTWLEAERRLRTRSAAQPDSGTKKSERPSSPPMRTQSVSEVKEVASAPETSQLAHSPNEVSPPSTPISSAPAAAQARPSSAPAQQNQQQRPGKTGNENKKHGRR